MATQRGLKDRGKSAGHNRRTNRPSTPDARLAFTFGGDGAAVGADSDQLVQVLFDTFMEIQQRMEQLKADASANEKDALDQLFIAARRAYLKAEAEHLRAHDALTRKWQQDLRGVNSQIASSLDELESLTAKLDLIAEAVKLAAAITGVVLML